MRNIKQKTSLNVYLLLTLASTPYTLYARTPHPHDPHDGAVYVLEKKDKKHTFMKDMEKMLKSLGKTAYNNPLVIAILVYTYGPWQHRVRMPNKFNQSILNEHAYAPTALLVAYLLQDFTRNLLKNAHK